MKKFINPNLLTLIVPFLGIVGFLLRLWTIGPGPDADGLYPPQTLAWVLLAVVSVLTLAVILLGSLNLTKTGSYEHSYPKSLLGAIGCILGAAGIFICAFKSMDPTNQVLDNITVVLGFLSGACMLATAYFRFTGKKCPFIFHTIVSVYLAIRAFNRCRLWSNEPQIGIFLFGFLASLSLMLAMYQRATFDVDLGKRSKSLFWSLMSVYLCLVALPGDQEMLFYGGMALWLMTNLCSTNPVPKAPAPEVEPEVTE